MMIKRIALVLIALVTLFSFSTSVQAQAPTEESCNYEFRKLNDILFYDPCDDVCGATQSSVTTLTGADNREKVFNYLRAKGLTPEQAAGVAGNIQNESGFSPTRQEMSQTFPAGGWGLVQWTFGRRSDPSPEKGVVAYLNSKIPDVMSKYYSNEFGGGVTEATGFVPSGIPVEDNDKLLLNELDFLYKESSTGRTVSTKTVKYTEGLTAGENEWEALKKQTTVANASNLWVYNFEIPGNIDATAAERVNSGQAILDRYGSSAQTAGADECSDISGTVREKVIQIAEREYAAWSNGRKTSNGGDFTEYTYGVNGEWCAWFVSWVYKEAGYPVNDNAQPYYSFVSGLMELGQKNEKFEWHLNDGTYTPRPGDIAIHGSADRQFHTNLVISAESPSVITTIGGNEGDANLTPADRNIKKSESSSYWAGQAYGYVSPKG